MPNTEDSYRRCCIWMDQPCHSIAWRICDFSPFRVGRSSSHVFPLHIVLFVRPWCFSSLLCVSDSTSFLPPNFNRVSRWQSGENSSWKSSNQRPYIRADRPSALQDLWFKQRETCKELHRLKKLKISEVSNSVLQMQNTEDSYSRTADVAIYLVKF
jgi:hypothetical protein